MKIADKIILSFFGTALILTGTAAPISYFIAQDDKSDEEELFAYAVSEGYKDYKGLGWVLLLEHETEELFASVTKLRNNVMVISLLITALAIIFGLFFFQKHCKLCQEISCGSC